jgi:hypothetical protein
MTHHKSHRRRARSYRRKNGTRTRTRSWKHKRTIRRRYKARGGNTNTGGVDNYNPAGYTPVGTINPSVMTPPNYIPFNQDVSKIPFPLSTTNPPLPF